MNFEVQSIEVFEKQVRKLSKKYASIKFDLIELVKELQENPNLGTPIGKNCFKIRLAITSKNKGKSGGARIITHFVVIEQIVYLLSIYDKSAKENLTEKELIELLSCLPE